MKNFLGNYKKFFLETIKKLFSHIFFILFFIFYFFFTFLSGHSIRMVNLTRKENSTKKRGTLRLSSAPARYSKRKKKIFIET